MPEPIEETAVPVPIEEDTAPAQREEGQSSKSDASSPQRSDNGGNTELPVLWPGDRGALAVDARRALLQLIRGPMITSQDDSVLWRALLNYQEAIASRLSDLFLELVVDLEMEIAFVRNAPIEDMDYPKAVRNQPLTLTDTLMVLTLRKELLVDASDRVIIGREELIEQLAHYRPVSHLDEAAFNKRLNYSWSRLMDAGILKKTTIEDRCEVSPVLKLIFGSEEIQMLNKEFDMLLEELEASEALSSGVDSSIGGGASSEDSGGSKQNNTFESDEQGVASDDEQDDSPDGEGGVW